ncbi:hypothetical protein BURKHO8Y_450013 [Burkholderia sp. 8Y]|nr:hypothetical protein BURKHO8Y_450013 [Burkholderia sp. 8Y]
MLASLALAMRLCQQHISPIRIAHMSGL